jgi:pyruvate dehydrogenase E2 component (dihydrolipoamide acetyltransferase)
MVIKVQMPALSPTMTEGKIVSWNKKEGDSIVVGDVILEVETDKAIMEVESQNKGILGKILVNNNDVVSVGKTIALILEKGESADELKNYKVNDDVKSFNKCSENNDVKRNENFLNDKKNDNQKDELLKVNENQSNDLVFASPLAKKIAKINNINIKDIVGHGPNGRIVKSDVEAVISNGRNLQRNIGRNSIEFIDVEPSSMRRTIANRLTESKQQVPHWYLKIKVNMSNFLSFKDELNKSIANTPERKISVNDIIIMVVSQAMYKHPKINVSWANGKIRKYNNVDVSVAIAVNDGIFTPIIRNADQKGLLEISSETKQLVKKAKDGKLSPQEFQGGSIAISNLGMYGVQEFCSIINPPQSCIIAVGAIKNSVIALDENNFSINNNNKEKEMKII